MTRTLRRSGQVVALFAVVGLLALLGWRVTHQVHAPKIGSPAPVFTLHRLTGSGSVDLAALRGDTVVLNFWASWCIPCKQEASVLQRAWRRYEGKGVVFVGVDFHDAISDGRRFVAAHQLSFATVEDGSGDVTTGSYGVSQVPETYVVDRQGKVALHIAGPIADGASMREFQHALTGA